METKLLSAKAKKQPCPPSKRTYNKLSCCLKPDTPPKRPDPGIYSQYHQFQIGRAMTWDSPDITTNLSSGNNLDEEIVVKIRNYSPDSAAIGVYTKVAYSQFGIGFPRETLNILQTNLNKSGLPGDSSELRFPLPRQVKERWSNISTFITVEHPHDRETLNNKGEQSWSGRSVRAGNQHEFQFPIYNSLSASETFDIRLLESDWGASLSLNSINLLPGQSANISLLLTLPADAVGTKKFNVAAFKSDGSLYGGIFHRVDAQPI